MIENAQRKEITKQKEGVQQKDTEIINVIETLREELKSTKQENCLVAEELERTKSALTVAIQEKETMIENVQRKEMAKQEEEVHKKDTEIINKEKTGVKPLEEEKDLTKSEQHKEEDIQILEQKEQAVQEQMEQVTNENTKASVETTSPEKAMPTSKPVPNRSSNIPIGKKPTTPKHMSYASQPKHMTPKSSTSLQSEFQQAGYEIEDGFDSDENQNTFSELRRGDDASTGSLDDSLKGSESFVSLDNYKDIGSLKQRVGSAKERDRKYSQESETQLKERKSSQENEARLKEPQSIMAAMGLSSCIHKEEVLQKPVGSLATELSQASETSHRSNTVESLPLSSSNAEVDVTTDKGAGSLVEATAVKESVVLAEEQKKPFSFTAAVDDDTSSESESSDDEDVVITNKGDKCMFVCVSVSVCVCLSLCVSVSVWLGIFVYICYMYHIRRNIDSDFNLAIWRSCKDCQINLRHYQSIYSCILQPWVFPHTEMKSASLKSRQQCFLSKPPNIYACISTYAVYVCTSVCCVCVCIFVCACFSANVVLLPVQELRV